MAATLAAGEEHLRAADAGVLLRVNDWQAHPERPWELCPDASGRAGGDVGWARDVNRSCNAQINDRVSATLVNPAAHGLFDHLDADCYGLVVSPRAARVLCSYYGDGCTNAKTCKPDAYEWPADVCGRDPKFAPAMRDADHDGACLPGCGPQWCEEHGLGWDQLRGKGPWRCAWRGLRGMLRNQQACKWCPYNEIVLDASRWRSALPHTVEAWFVTERCGARDVEAVRASRRAMLAAYGLDDGAAPIVRYLPSTSPSWPWRPYAGARAFEEVTDAALHPSREWDEALAQRAARVTCQQCWAIHKGTRGDCSAMVGCDSAKCGFCTNAHSAQRTTAA